MFKIIGISMLASIALLPLRADAQTMSLTLAPKQSQHLANSTLWTIHATCTIQTNHGNEKISVNAVKNDSQVDGQKLTEGQKKSMPVSNHQSIAVSAEPGATVNIVNQGSDIVVASCST